MSRLDWIKRPIAHRGLHRAGEGIIENTPSAIQAAIDNGFAIEVDLRPASCGAPMVFHDQTLERLTMADGAVDGMTVAALKRIDFKHTNDRMLSLEDLLEVTAGKTPLVLEIKSDWSGAGNFERRIAEILKNYNGHAGVMSFDPRSMAAFLHHAPHLPRGLVSERFNDAHYWSHLTKWRRFAYRHLLSSLTAKPDFIAYDIRALPALAPFIARHLAGRPLLTWTVRSQEEQERAKRYADAAIFELAE